MKTLVVVPTFEEAQGIAALLHGVLAQSGASDVLVVDDASPDGTADVVRRVAAENPGRVYLRVRPRRAGHGSAFREGLLDGLRRGGHEALFVMDADSSHDPAAIPSLRVALREADLVIGSRYVPGGRITGWGPHRHVLSAAANRLARGMLGLPFKDCTAGFMGFRAQALRALPLHEASAEGYGAPIELKWLAWRAGLRVVEVPITFRDRVDGRSKLGPAQIASALDALRRMRVTASAQRDRSHET